MHSLPVSKAGAAIPPRQRVGDVHRVEPSSRAAPQRSTVVFLHGGPDSVKLWKPTQDRLAELGYRSVAIGLPGYGDAPRRRWGYTIAEVEDFLENAIQEHAEAPRTLIAHDWGAFHALRLVRGRPQLCERLVLVDVGSGMPSAGAVKNVLAILAYQASPFRNCKEENY